APVADLEELPETGSASALFGFVLQLQDADEEIMTDAFAAPVTLEVTVDAADVPANQHEVLIAYWNGDEWREVPATVTANEDGSLTLTATVDHFTIFGALTQPGRGTFMPAPAFPVSFTVWQGGGYS